MSKSQVPPDLIPYLLGEKDDDSSLQSSILHINIAFPVLVTVTIIVRLWVRMRMVRNVELDDLFMILAFLFAILLSTSCLIGEHFGLGRHIWNLSPNLLAIPGHTARITKALYGCYLSYSLAIAFVKFSLVAIYARLFFDSPIRKIIWTITFVVFALLICNIFAIIFTCIPIQAAWNYNIRGRCFPIIHFFYIASGINIVTDLALYFLPIPTLWSLNMPKPQRVILCMLFGLGAFTCIASILRLKTLVLTGNDTASDFSYNIVTSLNWCVIEVGTAIICTSLCSMRPLFALILPNVFSRFTTNTTSPCRNYAADSPAQNSSNTANTGANQSLPPSGKLSQLPKIYRGQRNAPVTGVNDGIFVQRSSRANDLEMQSINTRRERNTSRNRAALSTVYGQTRQDFESSSGEVLVLQGTSLAAFE